MERSQKFKNATVNPVSLRGSLENLRRMQFGEIDFALYQAGTQYILSVEEFERLDEYEDENGNMLRNANGVLDLKEFTRQRNPTEQDRERKAKAAFELLDTDNNGLLSAQEFNDTSSIRCVAVLYPEVVHLIVKDDLPIPITTPAQLRGSRVALGEKWTGTYAMSKILLEHFGMVDSDIERFSGDVVGDDDPDRGLSYYDRVKAGFESSELDAAIITIGYHSEFVEELFTDHKKYGVQLLPIVSAKGLMTKHVVLKDYEIPAWTYHNQSAPIPTVGVNAMLLAHADVDDVVVSEVTRLLMDEQFLKENKLGRLYRQSPQQRYLGAQDSPEFEIHAGAKDFYGPEIDVGQFERWDALRSIIASTLIACVIIGRWLVERHRRQT
jgi:TRAP transporter TAXI family solute receptor